jgi:quinoprotein glucose dehydrogenase
MKTKLEAQLPVIAAGLPSIVAGLPRNPAHLPRFAAHLPRLPADLPRLAATLLIIVAACGTQPGRGAGIADYDWPTYANDPGSSKYAALDQIDRNNVRRLQIAWSWDSPDNEFLKSHTEYAAGGFKSTPIKIADLLYISTPMGHVAAIDAATGEQKWVFDTRTWEHGRPANLGFNHRGVAYWKKGSKRRILMGTNNAFLWSLDADTGLPDKTFGTDGKVDLTVGLGRQIKRSFYSVVAAPVIVHDTVVLGAVVFDIPTFSLIPAKFTDSPPGHIRGFDVNTGEQKWIFHSIPQAGEKGNETWENDSWQYTGATNVWSLMSADPELGYVYLPLGAPTNDGYGGRRLGDNLLGNSLVCLGARTGKLVWYFQMIHHDLWDWDLPAAPNLVDITVDRRRIKAVAQVSKQGFIYVFDRVTGMPVWPIEERSVPQSDTPGERTSATQPFPAKPAPFEVQGISEDLLIDFTPELHAEALQIISQYRHGEIFTPPSIKGTIQLPNDGGGANWSGAAVDPQTSILYVPSSTGATLVQLVKADPGKTEHRYVRGGVGRLRGPQRLPLIKPPYSRISAINLNTGEYEWVVPNGEGKTLRKRIMDMGIPDPGPVGARGRTGPLVTKTLLFIGGYDGRPLLRALDKATGTTIHEVELPIRPLGAPMTYMVDGKQYISVSVGGGKTSKLVTLALP